MGKVVAGITISVDGFITGPGDGPGSGLGVDGERLHYWVFGGPWSYDSPGRGEPAGKPTGGRQLAVRRPVPNRLAAGSARASLR